MITPRRLVQQAKKWQLMAALGKRRLATMWPIKEANLRSSSAIADKGHCIVYASGGEQCEVPLVYLSTMVFGELLRMSTDEFGFTSEDRITVPCDVAVMAYVMCLLRRKPSEEVERVTVSSVVMPHGNQWHRHGLQGSWPVTGYILASDEKRTPFLVNLDEM